MSTEALTVKGRAMPLDLLLFRRFRREVTLRQIRGAPVLSPAEAEDAFRPCTVEIKR